MIHVFLKISKRLIFLYLAGSPRIKSIKQQIEKYPLTKTIYILHNPGYKKVKKPLPRQNAEADIAFSHIVACEFGIKHDHDKIIVLEDDFIFENTLLVDGVSEEIEKVYFSKSKGGSLFSGFVLLFLAFPVALDTKHWRVILGGTTHAIIHTRKGMERMIEDYNNNKGRYFLVLTCECFPPVNVICIRNPLLHRFLRKQKIKKLHGEAETLVKT